MAREGPTIGGTVRTKTRGFVRLEYGIDSSPTLYVGILLIVLTIITSRQFRFKPEPNQNLYNTYYVNSPRRSPIHAGCSILS